MSESSATDILMSCHPGSAPKANLHCSEERVHSDQDKMRTPTEQQTKKYHPSSVSMSVCFKPAQVQLTYALVVDSG